MRKRPNDVEKLDQISQSINPDGKGNLTIGKNLGVDGKLTLKSLVSASNPDGDITNELGGGGGGGGNLYNHFIRIHYVNGSDNGNFFFNYISKNAASLTLETLTSAIQGSELLCNGYIYTGTIKIVCSIFGENNSLKIHVYDNAGVGGLYVFNVKSDSELISDKVSPIN